MKVKVALKFRGREMQHTEFGFQVVQKFLAEITPFGHPDFQPKLIGKSINVMISPLPRNKRAKNPNQLADGEAPPVPAPAQQTHAGTVANHSKPKPANSVASKQPPAAFSNNPFAKLDVNPRQDSAQESSQ
jgi:translation initiation factor IF-3